MQFLAKIQDEKYIQDMYDNEYLYFKPLKDFRSTTNDPTGRLDPRELNVKNQPLSYLSVKIGDDEIVLSNLPNFSAQYMEHVDDPNTNCCSLYTIDIEINSPPPNIDDRCFEMGNKMLLIYNLETFWEILDESIEKSRYKYLRQPITYYDPKTYTGELTLHYKDQSFNYQNEYRILIQPTNNNPVNISLPGLKKISTVIDAISIKKLTIERLPHTL